MGLPIFITPVEPEITSRSTEKNAAVPRSSIRRQRTIRGGSLARSSENRRRRIQDLLDAESRVNGRSSLSTGPDMPSIASLQLRAHRLLQTERAINDRVSLSDPVSWERRYSPEGTFSNPLPPAPDPESDPHTDLEREREHLLQVRASREREIERLHQVRRDLRRMGRRRPAPTPPYTETDIAFMARSARFYRDSPAPLSLTPARSPDHLSHPAGEAEISSVRNSALELEESSDLSTLAAGRAAHFRELRDENRPSLLGRAEQADNVQAYNGASSSSIAGPSRSFRQFLHQARMDGLGDRDRSLSPERGSAWDTLLTGITPDPQPPSTGSSFASSSAAAAAAASSSSSGPAWASGTGTSMTSPDRTDESPALRDCDEPSSADSNTEDEDEELEDLNNLLRSNRRDDRLWRSSYADVARASRGAQSPDSSLEGMQRIISRLAERDDIPESWWASAGLRREPSS